MDDYRFCDVWISKNNIEQSLKEGEDFRETISMEDTTGEELTGEIYSSSIRVSVSNNIINGQALGFLVYINTNGLKAGDVLKANLFIITNKGEYNIPITISIVHEYYESSVGRITNLFHFTNLARNNWNEAVDFFFSDDFYDLICGQDYSGIYEGLRNSHNPDIAMEEFLVGINKKQPIGFTLEKDITRVVAVDLEDDCCVVIKKNGWGKVDIIVDTSSDFIVLSNDFLEEKDFNDGECKYYFNIDREKLHKGNNYGEITFSFLTGQITARILAANPYASISISNRKRRKLNYDLTRLFVDYKMMRLSKNKWGQQSLDLLKSKYDIVGEEYQYVMASAYINIISGNYKEAKTALDNCKSILENVDDVLFCFYKLLLCMFTEDMIFNRQNEIQVLSVFKKNPDWRIGWILLQIWDLPGFLSEHKIEEKLDLVLSILKDGCRSPLIYLYYISIINNNPSLLIRLSHENIRVLKFAIKNNLCSRELEEQIAYLGARLKEYDTTIIDFLVKVYYLRESRDVLKSICIALMRSDTIDKKYSDFYKKGIEADFTITKLYEAFMSCIDTEEDNYGIPVPVLLYFAYDNKLLPNQKAYLYCYLLRHRNTYPEIFDAYIKNIRKFAVENIYEKNINKNLSYIYQELLSMGLDTPDNLNKLSEFIHYNGVSVGRGDIANIIILDERLRNERVYPVEEGFAKIEIFGNNYTILLEDNKGNRMVSDDSVTIEKYFSIRNMINITEPYAGDSLEYNLCCCSSLQEPIHISEENICRYEFLYNSSEISDSYRDIINFNLMKYYMELEDYGEAGRYALYNRERIESQQRDEYIRTLVIINKISDALKLSVYFGPENIDPQLLVRIATLTIEETGMVEDPRLTYCIFSAFKRGRYNETVLNYLCRFYNGSSKDLRNIWKAAKGFDLPTIYICKKILEQTLETKTYMGQEAGVLREFVEAGGNESLQLKYLEYLADKYFVEDSFLEEYFFKLIEKDWSNGNELPLACMLAYLKFYDEKCNNKYELSDNEKKYICEYIYKLQAEYSIELSLMKRFADISPEARSLSGRTIIEYHGKRDAGVTINYCVLKEGQDKGYTREEMRHIYGGIYAKSFSLFFGESLQYYILESTDGVEELTESGKKTSSETLSESTGDRYGFVNDIVIATHMKDYSTALELIEEYKMKDYFVKSIFRKQ